MVSQASKNRVTAFIDCFLQSSYWQGMQFGSSSDMWTDDPERAQRCDDAAEYGGDGSTHAEAISDMRNAIEYYILDKRRWGGTYRFRAAIDAHFDALELWHEKNGSLHTEIG
jgi:hypothetical protein